MINKMLSYIEDKSIVILGFGIEGKSTYNFLRRHFPNKKITVSYEKSNIEEEKQYLDKDNNLYFLVQENYLKNIEQFDLIIKSPGVSFKGIDTTKFIKKVTSQLELFLEYMECYTIGITGTKGKSTTSSLIYKVLVDQNKKSILLGNIGVPIFDNIEAVKEDTIVVLEISSHGLEYIKKSTNIAIILNIYEEHLDHYESLQKYIEAKYNIFKYQNKSDIAIYNMDNKLMLEYDYKYKERDYGITMHEKTKDNTIYLKNEKVYYNNKILYDTKDIRNLKGMHNLNNIMFVLAVCNILKLDLYRAVKSINEFEPLEHRLEFVGKIDDVEYYNDSISTVPESTINCIETLKKVDTLILGGNDRGIDLTSFIEYLNNTDIGNIICMPKTGEYIYEQLDKNKRNVILVKNLEEAVKISKKVTRKDMICALSPAASSYGYFKNFKERGEKFKEFVKS